MSFLREVELPQQSFGPYAALQEKSGLIPNLFRAQSLRPDLIEAEVQLLSTVLLKESALSRRQKESIALVCSAARLSTYCVLIHGEMMRTMGITDPELEQLAVDHHYADIADADKALLDFALKLTERLPETDRNDVDVLRQHGFTDEQILEAVVMTGCINFFNILSLGLGTAPDFEHRHLSSAGV